MIEYVKGDATRPAGDGPKVLVHCCNDKGAWGAGFVLALSRRWPHVEAAYRTWARTAMADLPTDWRGRVEVTGPFLLGEVQFVLAEPGLWVANLVGQRGTAAMNGEPPIRYEAVTEGLREVRLFAASRGAEVVMPRMGAGLAGGRWERIEEIVEDELTSKDVRVTVYDLVTPP